MVRASQLAMLLSFLAFVVSIIVFWGPQWFPPAPHQVTCVVPVHQVDRAFTTETLEHVFRVKNHGPRPVTIQKILMQCGCTSVSPKLIGQVIAPGDEAEIPIQLVVGTSTGPLKKSIFLVIQEDPRRPVEMTITADVLPLATLNPRQFQFGELTPDDEMTRTVILQFSEGAPAKSLLTSTCNHGRLKLTVTPMEAPRSFQVEVRTQPPLVPGRISAMVFLQTEAGSLSVPVAGIVVTPETERATISAPPAATTPATP
jgi:hypothetical protein